MIGSYVKILYIKTVLIERIDIDIVLDYSAKKIVKSLS